MEVIKEEQPQVLSPEFPRIDPSPECSDSTPSSRQSSRPASRERPAYRTGLPRRSSAPAFVDPAIQARRNIYKSRSEGRDVGASDLTYELLTCSGLLIDYVWRQRHGTTSKGDAFEGLQTVMMKQAWSNLQTYRFSVGIICQEALQHQLVESITAECKELQRYPRVYLDSWRRLGQNIRKHNRDVMCMNVEVHNKVQLRQLLSVADHREVEPFAEQKGRVEEFWSAFSDRTRIITNKPRESDAKTPERQKYGMTWDLRKGPQWRIISPSPGTLKFEQLSSREQAYGFDARQGMGFRSSSTPQLRPPPSPGGSSGGSRPGTAERLAPIQSRHTYLQSCDKRGKVAMPTTFITGHSKCFSARGRKLVDEELLAVGEMLVDVPVVEEVDLYENSLITDAGLAQFLLMLSKDSILEGLRRLNIGRCILGSKLVLSRLMLLMQDCPSLRLLNLSKIKVGLKQQLSLAEAIGSHPALESVNVAEIGIGPGQVGKDVLRRILASKTVHSLDLSWNTFDGEAFEVLGQCVVQNTSVRSLRVANCATTSSLGPSQDFVPPLQLFLEQLRSERALTDLDISLNRVDFRTALILEDSLDMHKKLKHLTLDRNPLGVLGLRSILRLLCRDHTALQSFTAVQCNTDMPTDLQVGSVPTPIFTYTNPGGKYVLQLWRPYHRAVLRMLYKTMDTYELQPTEAFDKVVFTDKFVTKAYVHPGKDSNGVYEVLTEGELSLVFCVEKAIFKRYLSGGKSCIDEADNVGFLSRYYKEMRFQPGFKKVIPLFTEWSELRGDQAGQQVFIDALSKDFSITLPQLAHMCEAVTEAANECLYKLRPAAPQDAASRFMTNKFFHRLEDLLFTYQKLHNFLGLNLANPVGHYKLQLDNPSDFAVAERLLLLDRWEAAVDRKLERKDVSQYGNGSHLRNPYYQGRPLDRQYNSVAEWKLPEDGTFEVDYASNARAPANADVLSDDLWDRIMIKMTNSSCLPEDRVAAMRSISDTFWLRSSHMRSIIGYFKQADLRAEIFIVFYLRIVDLYNAKMFRVRFPTQEELKALQERLGYASFFPFFQPENARFELDLAVHDQRLCATMWVNLCQKEKYPQNLHDYGYTHPDGTPDKMPLGVPRSWGTDLIPKEGVFRALYMCAPEFRNFGARKDLAREFGFQSGLEDLEEDTVQWWTGLMEPPPDVLLLLEFLISRYEDIKQPFLDIDGEGGNGVITLMELTEGLDELECHKFDKKKTDPPEQKSKAKRIEDVFRYLDPGGEGSVSEEEWGVLGQLWKEFDYSIKEFVYFLMLTFGEDLLFAWEALDDDGSGELSEEEFLQAVEQIGYFGPASVVFRLLDASDDGNISFDEFQILEKYKPSKNRRASLSCSQFSRPSTVNLPRYRPPSQEDPLGMGRMARPPSTGSPIHAIHLNEDDVTITSTIATAAAPSAAAAASP